LVTQNFATPQEYAFNVAIGGVYKTRPKSHNCGPSIYGGQPWLLASCTEGNLVFLATTGRKIIAYESKRGALGHSASHAHSRTILERKRDREREMAVQMVFQIILLLFSIYAFVQAAAFSISSCKANCGDVNLKYPFGIGAGCYADAWFEVVCRNSLASPSPKPFLRILDLEVLNISLDGTVRVNFPTVYNCTNGTSSTANIVELRNSPFIFSQSENRFIAMGCNNLASMGSVDGSGSVIGGCMSICDTTRVINASSCNIGINCCQVTIPSDLDAFKTTMKVMNSKDDLVMINGCNSAFLVEEKWFKTDYRTLSLFVPVVLEWWIPYTSFISLPIANYNSSSPYNCSQVVVNRQNATFTCSCKAGFGGNPYVPEGCHGKFS
jgi:hypothetical protein